MWVWGIEPWLAEREDAVEDSVSARGCRLEIGSRIRSKNPTVGALIIRIGFWGPILKPLTIGEEVQNKAEPKEKQA